MSGSYRAVLFDLDGTLVNTIDLITASYTYAMEHVLGYTPSESEARGWIGRPLSDALREMHPEHAVELQKAYQEWNLANSERLIRPYPGVDGLLGELSAAGLRTGIVTSKRRSAADLALSLVGLTGRIDVLATLESTTAHKPEAAPLLFAAASLAAAPAECLYVGDATVDVQAAKAAGMGSVAVTWGAGEPHALRAAAPDQLVTSPDELQALLLASVVSRA